jgi:hypothetical protein
MQYLLLLYADETRWPHMSAAEREAAMAEYGAYRQALAKAGALVSASRLRPTSATTTVRIEGDRTQVLDGPYAEVKEQLGGFFLIDVPDLDAAIAWAGRCPAARHGSIEVRPLWPPDAA